MQWSKIKIVLTDEQKETLGDLKKQYQKNRKIFRRLKALEMRDKGRKVKEIMEITDASWDSVTQRFKLFCEWWFQLLCELHYDWRRTSEFEPYKWVILEMIDEKIYWSYKELHNAVCERLHTTKKQDALRKFCKKIWIWVTKSVLSDHEIVQIQRNKKKW